MKAIVTIGTTSYSDGRHSDGVAHAVRRSALNDR